MGTPEARLRLCRAVFSQHPDDDRMARPHSHTVDQQIAQGGDNRSAEIFGASRRSGIEQDQVMIFGGGGHGRLDTVNVVWDDIEPGRRPAPGLDLRRQDNRVELGDFARRRPLLQEVRARFPSG